MATSSDLKGLSATELEQRLRRQGLTASERSALADELSRRLADDLLKGRGTGPADEPGVAGPRDPPRSEPEARQPAADRMAGAADRPQVPGPPPRRTGSPTAGGATAAPARTPAPRPRAEPDRRPRARRRTGRLVAALVALAVAGAGAWGALEVLDTGRGGSSGGGEGFEYDGPLVDVEDDLNPVVTGPVGGVAVGWVIFGIPHTAEIRTDGDTGVANVSYLDPQTGQVIGVQQDLTLRALGSGWAYVGSDPRSSVTGEPVGTYQPDTFLLRQGPDGGLLFSEVCGTQTDCVPLTLLGP